MSDKAGATEFTLGLSDRLENFSYKGDLADAKLVQNIIFGTPTLGARDCFLNIKKYLREPANDITFEEITSKLNDLLSIYAPNVKYQNLKVTTSEKLNASPEITNSLIIFLSIGDASQTISFATVLKSGGEVISRSFF